MTALVRVKGFWINPVMVVAIWHEHVNDRTAPYWRVTMRCEEGQVWYFKHDTEEEAVRDADALAHQINQQPVPFVMPPRDERPHSRACGVVRHDHTPLLCAIDCPTCGEGVAR